jgi:hypothetical protein
MIRLAGTGGHLAARAGDPGRAMAVRLEECAPGWRRTAVPRRPGSRRRGTDVSSGEVLAEELS